MAETETRWVRWRKVSSPSTWTEWHREINGVINCHIRPAKKTKEIQRTDERPVAGAFICGHCRRRGTHLRGG